MSVRDIRDIAEILWVLFTEQVLPMQIMIGLMLGFVALLAGSRFYEVASTRHAK